MIPPAYALADWRRRVNDLYAEVRRMPPLDGWRHWHATREALFRAHPVSPLPPEDRAGFGGLHLYPYDAALRFTVDLARVKGEPIAFDLGDDGGMTARPIARTDGLAAALGAELTAWWIEGYGGGLFIPFRDATSGTETYGGGRYIVDAIKGADLGPDASGRLILDFNFAYAPSCAVSPAFVCPLAPPENHLPRPVRGGERLEPQASRGV